MKVAIITNIPSPYRVDLFNYICKTIDITVIYSAYNEDNRNWDKDFNVQHDHIFLKSKTIKIKGKNDYKYIHIPLNIRSTLKSVNPSIVIGSEYNPTILNALIWCKKNEVKYISWSDGTLNSERNINCIQRLSRKFICKNANAFIASSTKTKEAQVHYGANLNKIFISYLTVDINKYLITKKYNIKNNFLFVGRITKGKGLDLLFNALKDLKGTYHLNIVGDGPEEKKLKELADNLKISNKISFCGFKNQEEIVKYYANSDVFILPTRQDCFGLVITEAMCSGLPVIVSKFADGAYDLIDEGKNGFIINPYNAEEIKEKMMYFINNENTIKVMGQQSFNRVKKFSIEEVSKEFIKAILYVGK
ncbi:glycosyltransferase [Clostridium felsineum]|uniref:glycosyltransferase n=1 Tax=Clostridium felsineum TaxID=36839 RepID=UPI00098C27AA|nr:glycosyltransferase [Clostridium felsineum]URZ03539.1 D-inositol-3-phosphate glycosyltransferase [Clostridium felsineum]